MAPVSTAPTRPSKLQRLCCAWIHHLASEKTAAQVMQTQTDNTQKVGRCISCKHFPFKVKSEMFFNKFYPFVWQIVVKHKKHI